MTRYFMKFTPLFVAEVQMMTPPRHQPRGSGRIRSSFRYSADDVRCKDCTRYDSGHHCHLNECVCLEERIEAGVVELNALARECFGGRLFRPLQRRLRDELNREFPTWLTIWPRGALDKLSGAGTVKTGNEAFDRRFRLTCGDEAAALRILTPSRMERFLTLADASFGKFAVNLNPGGRLYLAVHSGRGFFEIGKGHETPAQLRERFARELKWFTDIINVFRSI